MGLSGAQSKVTGGGSTGEALDGLYSALSLLSALFWFCQRSRCGFGEERPLASQMLGSRWCWTVFRLHLSSS